VGGRRGRGVLRVRKERLVMVGDASPAQVVIAEATRTLSMQMAKEPVTNDLLDTIYRPTVASDYDMAVERVKDRMKALMAARWRSDPAFVKAVHDTIGPDLEEYMWVQVPKMFSHHVISEDLPTDQVWLVD
jgi:hypothetical protein